MSQVFSTREMAQLCGVNESTIKRWADSGKLTCVKTPGGHRKFKIRDVLTFLTEHGFDGFGPGAQTAVDDQGVIASRLLKRDWTGLSQSFVQIALEKTPSDLADFCVRLLTAGCTLVEICDRVVQAGLNDVGERWAGGAIGVVDEHLIATATERALLAMGEVMPKHKEIGHTALCCPAERDEHRLGVRMSRIVLEQLGWTAHAITSGSPAPDLAAWIRRERPTLVAISVVHSPVDPAFAAGFDEIWKAAESAGTRVALGGRSVNEALRWPHHFIGRSMEDLVRFARILHAEHGSHVEVSGAATE